MQKYSPISDETPAMREDSEDGSWYWCQDVDDRIEQLEKALLSCKTALHQHLKHQTVFEKLASDAYDEAIKALSL